LKDGVGDGAHSHIEEHENVGQATSRALDEGSSQIGQPCFRVVPVKPIPIEVNVAFTDLAPKASLRARTPGARSTRQHMAILV